MESIPRAGIPAAQPFTCQHAVRAKGDEVPRMLQEVLSTRLESMTASPMATAALAYARAGFAVMPFVEDGKTPHTVGHFRHAHRSATADFDAIRDHFYDHPFDNVGVVYGGSFALLDIDHRHGGSIEVAEALGVPVDGYRERSPDGWHIPLRMPDGHVATQTISLTDGVDVIAATRGAISPWSRVGEGWYRPEEERNIWRYGQIPADWDRLSELTLARPLADAATISRPTETDVREARRVLDHMERWSEYRDRVRLNRRLQGEVGHRSEADAVILSYATHFLRGHPRRSNVLLALLEMTSEKLHDHANPTLYAEVTVRKAMGWRDAQDGNRLDDLGGHIRRSLAHESSAVKPKDVIDPKYFGRGRSKRIRIELLAFAGSPGRSVYYLSDGWRRLPVNDMAERYGVSAESIRLAQIWLRDRGLIERDPKDHRHEGGHRCDARIRLTTAGYAMLASIRAEHRVEGMAA